MWNLVYSNPLCHKRQQAQQQLMHLNNIQTIRPCVNNSTPWKPSHSLSRLQNKYTNTTEQEIANKNNILLSKMMDIQKKGYDYKLHPSCSSLQLLRKREKTKISSENQSILKRLQSASSTYGRKVWQTDIERISKYRENLQKRTSKLWSICNQKQMTISIYWLNKNRLKDFKPANQLKDMYAQVKGTELIHMKLQFEDLQSY